MSQREDLHCVLLLPDLMHNAYISGSSSNYYISETLESFMVIVGQCSIVPWYVVLTSDEWSCWHWIRCVRTPAGIVSGCQRCTNHCGLRQFHLVV